MTEESNTNDSNVLVTMLDNVAAGYIRDEDAFVSSVVDSIMAVDAVDSISDIGTIVVKGNYALMQVLQEHADDHLGENAPAFEYDALDFQAHLDLNGRDDLPDVRYDDQPTTVELVQEHASEDEIADIAEGLGTYLGDDFDADSDEIDWDEHPVKRLSEFKAAIPMSEVDDGRVGRAKARAHAADENRLMYDWDGNNAPTIDAAVIVEHRASRAREKAFQHLRDGSSRFTKANDSGLGSGNVVLCDVTVDDADGPGDKIIDWPRIVAEQMGVDELTPNQLFDLQTRLDDDELDALEIPSGPGGASGEAATAGD